MLSTLSIAAIAHICHDANRAVCIEIGDYSQVVWEEAALWQKDSAIVGVKAIIDNPSITPEQLHDKWSADKIAAGWVYGETKDTERKTHPCLVSYDELSDGQKYKDSVFRGIVLSLTSVFEIDIKSE